MTPELRALAAAVAGEPLPDGIDRERLVDDAIEHGVAALVAQSPAFGALGDPGRIRIAHETRITAVRTAAYDDELGRVLDGLAAEDLHPLLIKGAHLAHAVYAKADLRPRADTDLLIQPAERERAAAALARCGYVPSAHVRGRLILGQFHVERAGRGGIAHHLDVHWRVAAPLVIDRTLPAETLLRSAVPLPAQGPHARAPAMPQALLVSCVHLASHHWQGPALLWLYDVKLLAEALDRGGRDAFVELSIVSRCRAIARHVLDEAREAFRSPALDNLANRLGAQPGEREPSAALLRVRRPADALWIDLRAARWSERARLFREHLLPHREYMRQRGRGSVLPLAYMGRAVRGARRWMAVSGADRTGGSGE